MAHSDVSSAEKFMDNRYKLTKVFGVTNLLKDIHTLREHRFVGTDTTYLSCTLIDFERVVEKTSITEKQKQALFLHYENDMTQGEVAEAMGITQQAVSKHIDSAIAKIVATAKEEDDKK